MLRIILIAVLVWEYFIALLEKERALKKATLNFS